MREPKLQGFPLNYTKACSSRRGKLTLFNTKSMRWPLFSVNYIITARRMTSRLVLKYRKGEYMVISAG